MKLDRNNPEHGGRNKYAVIRLRDVAESEGAAAHLEALAAMGCLDWGYPGESDEFFVIKLKDKYASLALAAYANAARGDDDEYAEEVSALALRAGPLSPYCKKPD